MGRDGYRVGSRSLALATLIGPRPALLTAARPALRALAEISTEVAVLNLRSGTHRVQVLGAQAKGRSPDERPRIGERAPLTSGASGIVILANLPTAEADQVLASRPAREPRPTPARLAQIRTDGYAITFSANHVGVSGIGAPLLAPIDGYPLGSLAIGGAERRLPEDRLRELLGPPRRPRRHHPGLHRRVTADRTRDPRPDCEIHDRRCGPEV